MAHAYFAKPSSWRCFRDGQNRVLPDTRAPDQSSAPPVIGIVRSMKRSVLLVSCASLLGCGGSVGTTSDAGPGPADGGVAGEMMSVVMVGDATSADSGQATTETDSATDGCPAALVIPDADVYKCSPLPAGSAGCPSQPGDPHAVYPAGCVLLLPYAGACVSPCCGPVSCTCQQASGTTTLAFTCPL
jgi:hypothetical protein